MLLRSTSMPNSLWMAAAKDAPATLDFSAGAAELAVPGLPRVRSIAHLPSCLSTSSSFGSSPTGSSSSSRRRLASTLSRALSEGDLSDPMPGTSPFVVSSLSLEEEAEEEAEVDQMFGKSSLSGSSSSSLSRLLSASGLDENGMVAAGRFDECFAPVGIVDDACGGAKDGGGRRYGGGGRGRGGGGGSRSGSDNGDATDAYYLQMIEANPASSLILGNYAKFLIEVRGDTVKAQQYCERAIVANPGDASVLALYADLVWQTSRDAARAEGYFDRAVKVDPDDCYIMASYAKFLWDAEDDEEEAEGAAESSKPTPSPFLHGANSPIAAAS